MKSLPAFLSAVGLSLSTFIVQPVTATCIPVKVPQLSPGLVLGVTGYYLRPTISDDELYFANFIDNGTFNHTSVHPKYDWGWGINAGYILCNKANDINASYST